MTAGERTVGITRDIWLVSQEIARALSREIAAGQPDYPGNLAGNGGKFPGKYGVAQPHLVG